MHYGFRGTSPNIIIWAIPIILLVLIAVSIYMIRKNKREGNQPTKNSAIKILDERFAKGEIDEEEYIRRKENL